jgi:hypothetical protein
MLSAIPSTQMLDAVPPGLFRRVYELEELNGTTRGVQTAVRIAITLGIHAIGLGWLGLALDAFELVRVAWQIRSSFNRGRFSGTELIACVCICALGVVLMFV